MIKFEFTVDEVNLILSALQELPAKLSMQLIIKLKEDGQKQITEKENADNKEK
jgi:hypothetical protein